MPGSEVEGLRLNSECTRSGAAEEHSEITLICGWGIRFGLR